MDRSGARSAPGGGRVMRVSFEIFPPKTPEGHDALWKSIQLLDTLQTSFISVTYGAGGTTRERSLGTIRKLIEFSNVNPAAHVTCVGAPKSVVDNAIDKFWDAGVRHFVALRGDPPGGAGGSYEPHQSGYQTTADLVRTITVRGGEVSVSAYPERHPESPNFEADLD